VSPLIEAESERRRVPKSLAAFRTISEVAGDLDVPQHVLRFWETRFKQLKPLKRGGGRRYYRPEDVNLLRRIRLLLYAEGYTIKGAQKFLRESEARLPPRAQPGAEGGASGTPAEENGEARAEGLNVRQRRSLKRLLAELEAMRETLRDFTK
jgi:DNA-binding transcriptional MerR regulator